MSDAFWANVALLCHFNGVNNATTFTEETGKALTAAGNAKLSTAQQKFGTASALFDGTGDAITTPDHADFNLTAGDFTIELFMRPQSVLGSHDVIAKRATSANFGSFLILQSSDALSFYCSSTGVSWDIANGQTIAASGLNTANFFHVAVTRAGTTFRTYFNGVQGSTWTSSASVFNDTTALSIGGAADASSGYNGYIDEVRISKGLARYTGASSFTPPSAEFEGAPPAGSHGTAAPSMLARTASGARIAAGAGSMLARTAVGGHNGIGTGLMLARSAAGSGGHNGAEVQMLARTAAGTGYQAARGAAVMEARTADATGHAAALTVFDGVAATPTLVATGVSGNVLSIVAAAPAPSLVVVATNPAIITAALTAPAGRLVSALIPGNVLTAAISAATPIMAAAGYPAYTLSAALTAPAPYLVGSMSAPTVSTFMTWVLNTRKPALTAYDGFDFNSYTVFNGVVLAAGSAGVSVLGEQDDDAGTDIHAVVRTGAEGFASSLHKRVPRIYTSVTTDGDMLFKTITAEGGTRTYSLPYNGAVGLTQRRVPVGKGPRSRFWSFQIENVAGCDFQINDVLVLPTALRRRVQ